MAHERFLDPDEMERLLRPRPQQEAWPPVEHCGETYYFVGNVKRSSKEHHKYQALKAGGKYILIRENAVDTFGAPMPGYLEIYQARTKPIPDTLTWIAKQPRAKRGSR